MPRVMGSRKSRMGDRMSRLNRVFRREYSPGLAADRVQGGRVFGLQANGFVLKGESCLIPGVGATQSNIRGSECLLWTCGGKGRQTIGLVDRDSSSGFLLVGQLL